MTDFILKSTNCNQFCDFTNIVSFCIECPALLCKDCKISLHGQGKSNHEIIDFENKQLDWKNKDVILDIFVDKHLGENVFKLVSADISEIECRKPESNNDYFKSSTDCTGWECESCTFKNKSFHKECEMCCFKRKNTDFDLKSGHFGDNLKKKPEVDYNLKLMHFSSKMKKNFDELDEIHSANGLLPFENIAIEYMRKNPLNLPLEEWFPTFYPERKCLHIVNDILNEKGFGIEQDQLDQEYIKKVKEENASFLSGSGNFAGKAKLIQSTEFLELSEINKSNKIPENFMLKDVNEQDIWNIIFDENTLTEKQCRMLITELDLKTSEPLLYLQSFITDPEIRDYLIKSSVEGNVKLVHFAQCISEQKSIDLAMNFLRKSCFICCIELPFPEMQGFLTCGHEFCKNCFSEWLKDTISTKFPSKWNCPSCEEEEYEKVDRELHYSHLRAILGENKTLLNFFESKLLSERLQHSKNFHWCANEQCTNGFEAEGFQKIQCPTCQIDMCVNCNRVWQAEHEDKTCQEFEMWMLRNDPDLSKVLNNIGIECPNCGMRYALAAGGCLHFDCNSCSSKFCGGCDNFFVNSCGNPVCRMTNFHAHHPRNCTYFLRDYDTVKLEEMLKNQNYPKLEKNPENNCKFMKTSKEMKDELCNEPVYATTGLCETHYREYLIQFINRFKIDPADFSNLDELKLMWMQALRPELAKEKNENQNAFVERLRKLVKDECAFYIPKGLKDEQPAAV